MKVLFSLYLLLFGVCSFGCSKAIEGNNSVSSGTKAVENTSPCSEKLPQSTPSPIIKSPKPNPRDVVLFDGRNYIKKSGWKKPSKKDAYIDESYDPDAIKAVTKSRKRVKTKAIFYLSRDRGLYSEDFHYEEQDLDYLKGELELSSFKELSAKGKVFFYSITAQRVASKNDLCNRFIGYRIMDTDGDGIFETLLGYEEEIVVPGWVLR